ncbi:MAG: hypothetical protein WCW84_07850 [Sulfurimonas sp.]|jgi:hypothetical protein
MPKIDRIKADIEDYRENYKMLLTFMLMLFGAIGSMIFMAFDKNQKYYVLAALALIPLFLVAAMLRKVWKDLEQKKEELENV